MVVSYPEDTFRIIIDIDSIEVTSQELRTMMLDFDSAYTEKDISERLKSLDLTQTGTLIWAEFRKIFGIQKEAKHLHTRFCCQLMVISFYTFNVH